MEIMHILVVEDDFISRKLLCRYLDPYGECDVAINGMEAISAVRHALDVGSPYDLICLDIMMPGMSGQETLVGVRSLEQEHVPLGLSPAKVIMTTALEDSENIRLAFEASADDYIVKPIEKKKFLSKLTELGLKVVLPV
jgi:two-component system, chemotaxis family, chemotaxis protein CheY